MYKLLLCWRYLRMRYIALACIVSVMLGVATMIVVNAVMAGFSYEMKNKIHGILSDIVFESVSLDGFPDADRRMAEIRAVAGQYIAGMSPTTHIPALLSYHVGNSDVTRQITMIGVEDATYSSVSDFGQFLQHPENRKKLDFNLRENGYDIYDHQVADKSKLKERTQMFASGFEYRRRKAKYATRIEVPDRALSSDPFSQKNASRRPASAGSANESATFDPAKNQHTGCVLGIGLCAYHMADGGDGFLAIPGDDIEISYPTAGKPPKVLSTKFTIVDFYESKMNEYDSSFVFVPIRKLQEIRGMIDPTTNVAYSNAIQIRLKPGVDLNMVRDLLRKNFPPQVFRVSTWQDKEGALLSAVHMETIVLNILLFLIICVAGFGILAIFFMIVFEKTRDIGILKALGASDMGILGIFLSYGFSLGTVGAGVGVVLGILFVKYINEIADVVGWVTGQPVFDPSIYYFQKIPAIIDVSTVALIMAGALLIAIMASILPALRAAWLHPVQALRYE